MKKAKEFLKTELDKIDKNALKTAIEFKPEKLKL